MVFDLLLLVLMKKGFGTVQNIHVHDHTWGPLYRFLSSISQGDSIKNDGFGNGHLIAQ